MFSKWRQKIEFSKNYKKISFADISEISPKRDITCHWETIENLKNRGNFPESCPLIKIFTHIPYNSQIKTGNERFHAFTQLRSKHYQFREQFILNYKERFNQKFYFIYLASPNQNTIFLHEYLKIIRQGDHYGA